MIVSVTAGLDRRAADEFVRVSAAKGATIVMVREPTLSARALSDLAADVRQAARTRGLRTVISERLDVALAAGADGVHLRADGPPVAAARGVTPPGFLIGRSAHSEAEIDRAAGADYLIYGTIFETPSKPGVTGQGLEGLRRAVARFDGPVLAIGGISPANVSDVLATGAAGYASIRMFRIQ